MDIPTQAELLGKIADFCRRHDMPESRFGRDAVNNPAFISGLRREPPVSPTLETLNKVSDFMRRTDAEARFAAAAAAPPPPPPGEDNQLPFGQAPVSPTGDFSPTSSPTTAPPPLREANGSCPSCSADADPERDAA